MAQGLRIIGIDPGLRHMGWGVIEAAGSRLSYVGSGRINPAPEKALAERLAELFCGLESVLAAQRPDEAAIEQTFVNRDGRATLKLGQARGIAMLAPARAGLPVAEYAPNVIKKSVVGSGHADKAQIRAMIAILLPRAAPDSDDAADALAIAITHAHHRSAAALMRRYSAAGERTAR